MCGVDKIRMSTPDEVVKNLMQETWSMEELPKQSLTDKISNRFFKFVDNTAAQAVVAALATLILFAALRPPMASTITRALFWAGFSAISVIILSKLVTKSVIASIVAAFGVAGVATGAAASIAGGAATIVGGGNTNFGIPEPGVIEI